MNILFYLPSNGGGGGAHSVVQECIAMRAYGVYPTIGVTPANLLAFNANYPELNERGVRLVTAGDATELAGHLASVDVVCATTYGSVTTVRDALKIAAGAGSVPKAAYYVQDYEPLFCAPGSEAWHKAIASYTDIKDAVLFAKTDWLRDVVLANTGATVAKVKASIDHAIYHPGQLLRGDTLAISAMVRTKTKRRAPRRTIRVLDKLIAAMGDRISVTIFGSSDADLAANALVLSDRIVNRGPISRTEVAGILRTSDLFLDLSDFQAFGRTGLEAMASGCVPVLPVFGGATEYARQWNNAILVDPRSDDAIIDCVERFAGLSPASRRGMRSAAIATALDYTPEKAAFSEVSLFSQMIGGVYA